MSEPLTREALRANFRRGTEAAAQAEPEVTRLTRSSKANRYPGTCIECGQRVEAGEGTVLNRNGQWLVKHLDGQHPMLTVNTPKIESKTGQVFLGPLLPGIYTIQDNTGEHETYRIRVQATDADFAPGETVIEFLSGPDNTHDYTSFGFIKNGSLAVWKKFREVESMQHRIEGARALLAHPERATVARTCIRCHALLTTPDSLAAGMGPTCRDKGW